MARTSHSPAEREVYNFWEEFLLYRTDTMNLQQATSLFQTAFPEFDRPRADTKPCLMRADTIPCEPNLDEYAVARCVAKLFAEHQNRRIQSAFNVTEAILIDGDQKVRDWVSGFLRALRDVAGWRASGHEAFVGFLQPETRRAWSTLEAIQSDLADCSILEEEITMWRVVHHGASTSPVC